MKAAYLADTIRAAEEPLLAALPGVLMQRAAAGLASVLLRELRGLRGAVYGSRALLVVGAGNNGGDALYAGARLLARGVAVAAWRTSGHVYREAWAAFRAAGGRELDAVGAVAALGRADLVVDGVLGIGGRPGLREPVALFAQACADAGVPVVAVDLPSGLAADSPSSVELVETGVSTSSTNGGVSHFTAARTVTFGGLKYCQVLQPAASACGVVEVIDIGLDLPAADLRCWELSDVAAAWPFPGATSDKYSRGVVGLDTGSDAYPGAAVLSTLGAVHAGAGMVRFAGAPAASGLIRSETPNVVFGTGRVQARVLGCGWGDSPDGAATVERALADGVPLVLDADALRFLPDGQLGEQVLLTPHAGELARLLDAERPAVAAAPIAAVQEAARRYRATVLLKGATQYVAGPDGAVGIAVPGPHWTAQAGSGDVLAGICGTLLAAGLSPARAALAAASVQAIAAAQAPGPLPPQELATRLPAAIAGLRAPSSRTHRSSRTDT
ncbi:MAG: bifunctional ADP-dependent NAD(P)H-hydrate dehydratase/NAD(P)H-hydrate epimerase [Micropruina sp.]|uniref:bifunctional ADP-dependent NAD(P)H-hydrate dehydratase/NAD(P)H-hydrate epimerase n=1 Tax=Micropruina sp. TaxID=2737536 RepID=UPI0039E5A18D